MDWLADLANGLLYFEFYYPLFMAYLWMIGAIYYNLHWEKNSWTGVDNPPASLNYPGLSFIIPCHNEAANIEDTIEFLAGQDYPEFEIIAVNDGSNDRTGRILDQLNERLPALRVVHLTRNQGKAAALHIGTLVSKYEFLVCIDGDALLDAHAGKWLARHFLSSSRVGAVTGNPRIRTRSTLLGKIQVGEFSAIIGMIKRAQRIYGRIFTISGVVAAFRKSALHQVGYWGTDTVTDDIDISWKLQLNHWDVRFEPNALCWILMPETLQGLLRQRIRWARGGMEALLRYLPLLPRWRSRRMWGVCLEYFVSVMWSYFMIIVVLLWLVGLFVSLPDAVTIPTILPGWNGVVLGMTCLLQFAVSLAIDARFEKGIGKTYYWMVWYPVAYWLINLLTTVIAVPMALFGKRRQRVTWVSPDRGLQP